MRTTSNGSGLRLQSGVSRLGLVGGLLVLLMLAVSGCGGVEPDDTVAPLNTATVAPLSTSAPAQSALPGDATWILDSLDGRPIIENSFVTLKIDEDWLVGYDGCNSYGGRFEDGRPIADAGGMFSGPPIGSTQRDCAEPEGVTEQADAYVSVLMQGERYRVVGDQLEIFDGGDAARLVFVRQAPLPGGPSPINLAGSTWRQLTEGDTDGEVRAATLAFLDDRLVAGATACRGYLATYGATYSQSEGSVRFPSQTMLKSPQPCPEESRRLEGEFGDFLTWANEYSIYEEGRSIRLGIRSATGETLTFEPLPATVEDIADANWNLVAFVELRDIDFGMWHTRPTSVVQGTEVTVSFDKDGISGVSGVSGCNSYAGVAEVEDGSIKIDVQSFSHTEKACEGLDGLMEQEERYLDLLPRMTRYGTYGDGLFMQSDDVFLLFQAE